MKDLRPKIEVEAPRLAQAGFALVIVLGSVVLLSVALAVLMSLTRSERIASKSSGDVRRVNLLAETALDTLVQDLRQEMHDGSINAQAHQVAGVTRYIPTSGTTSQPMRTVTETSADEPLSTFLKHYLKASRRSVPFHSGTVYSGTGALRASAASTESASLNGRLIRKERWNGHFLFGSSLPANFQSPDWVYVTRGKVGVPLLDVATLKDSKTDNKDFSVGRFAYTIHDVGARLDINVAGNLLEPSEKAKKGLLHQADLSLIPGIKDPTKLLQWRSKWSAARGGKEENELFDPKRDFIKVIPGDQTFLSRGDLINFTQRNPDVIDKSALPYLTTFSRELNQPSYRPKNPSGPHYRTSYDYATFADTPPPFSPTSTDHPKGYNLDLANARNAAGKPAIKRRFPLSRLSWITKDGPQEGRANDIHQYFGLRWNADDLFWDYTGPDGNARANHIKRLDQIPDSREPDFFELLMAGILEGSLGVHTTRTMAVSNLVKQRNPCLQAIQIGACIIDQANEGNIPTQIRINNGEEVQNHTYSFFGIKNLPYLHGFTVKTYRPTAGNTSFRDYMYTWLIPEMWNPHGNAAVHPGLKFRMRILGGRNQLWVTNVLPPGYTIKDANGKDTSNKNITGILHSLGSPDRWIEWDGSTDFSSVTLLDATNSVFHPLNGDTSCLQYSDFTDGSTRIIGFCIARDSIPDYRFTNDPWDGVTRDVKPFYIPSGTGIEADLQVNDGSGWRTYWRLESGDRWRDDGRLHSRSIGGSGPGGNEAPFFVRPVVHSRFMPIDPFTNRFGWVSKPRNSEAGSTWNQWIEPIPFRPEALTSGTFAAGLATVEYGPYENAYSSTPIVAKENHTQIVSYIGRLPQNIPTPDTSVSVPGTRPQIWFYMTDADGIVRFGDGVLGGQSAAGNPMMQGTGVDLQARPFMLNRPFKSVGELGYVYRGLPWKTLDFFTYRSADSGLLDLFCMTESDAEQPVVGGKISANTQILEVLASVIAGAERTENGATTISSAHANNIASRIRAQGLTTEGPYRNPADIFQRLASATFTSNPAQFPAYKVQREAVARALAGTAQTRTWNLLIDLVAQVGRFPTSATSLDNFHVNAEQHYWIHLAVDRYTGEVIDQQWEIVAE